MRPIQFILPQRDPTPQIPRSDPETSGEMLNFLRMKKGVVFCGIGADLSEELLSADGVGLFGS